jgi:Zn-dependent protease
MDITKFVIGGIVCLIWIFSIACHEFAHAIVAYWGGDKSVKTRGYLTLNPFAYTSTGMTVVLPAVFLLLGGFALPGAAVYIKSGALRNRFWRSAVSAAGPLATLAITVLLAIGFSIVKSGANDEQTMQVVGALAMLVYFHCASVVLNILPMPGLDGFGVIEPWLPKSVQATFAKYGNAGFAVILMLLWMPIPNRMLWSTAGLISDCLGVPAQVGELGFHIFRMPVSAWALVLIGLLYVFRKKDENKAAYDLLKQEKYSEALPALDKLLVKEPDEISLLAPKAFALLKLDRKDESLATLNLVLAKDPGNEYATQLKAVILQGMVPRDNPQ